MVILVANEPSNGDGHHEEYIATLARLISNNGEAVRRSKFSTKLIFSRDTIFFMMFEDNPVQFVLSALVRGLLGRRTAGILFLYAECIAPVTLRLRTKRAALRFLRHFPGCAVVTIMPFTVEPQFEKIAKYGIYDFQWWDLAQSDIKSPAPSLPDDLISKIDSIAGSRKLVVALGTQNLEKGFDYFCKVWNASGQSTLREKFLFVSGGRVVPETAEYAKDFEQSGGVLIDRSLSREELLALYKRCDLVWCCYSPVHNRSSGIFGRSVQFGAPAAVRSGSYVAALADQIGHPVIALDWDRPERAASQLVSYRAARREPEETQRCVEDMKYYSLECLGAALGITLRDQ